ncbi:restriction endonuclease [Bradyrhizobium sp. HKCCYLRH1073]|uniref:restriction endonuclease n=1 Tax=unclassified Bradyrhizobium TaxID=2631580 RepID=UPI002916A5E3|nr:MULTISPECIES: restriction endonuclease [unclassified Bradyrhizobium]
MATLDFSEMTGKPAGETFEGLIRLVGQRLGVSVIWTGRGTDQGRDMIFIESQIGQIGSNPIRGLVNCKDNSRTNQAVTEHDVGAVLDKLVQHKCDGFLLATTTTAGTALKAKLDEIARDSTHHRIQTKVWDRLELTSMLLSDQFSDLLRQFFPEQSARNSAIEIDAARLKLEASLPRQVVGAIRRHLVPYAQRYASLSGENVWPHDTHQQKLINELRPLVVNQAATTASAQKLSELQFESFLAFADQLIRSFPNEAYVHLLYYATITEDSATIFNLIEILQEFDQFSLNLEHSIAARSDEETLWDLYHDVVEDRLWDKGYWWDGLPDELDRFNHEHDEIDITDIDVDHLQFRRGDSIKWNASVIFHMTGTLTHSDSELKSTETTFSYFVSGGLSSSDSEIPSSWYPLTRRWKPRAAVIDEVSFLR